MSWQVRMQRNAMSTERAIWFPFWYELDQNIEVGQVNDFDFFEKPPNHLPHDDLPVFHHGGTGRYRHVTARKRILSIHHPQLGDIRKIDTSGLEYTITMLDGRVLKVEAEETPGLIYELLPTKIDDWRIYVEMEPA